MFSIGEGSFTSDWVAIFVACALLLAPVLAGLLVAALLRAVLTIRRRALWTVPLVVVPVALSLAAIPRTDQLSFWDLLITGLGFAAGAVLAMGQPDGAVLRGALRTSGRITVGLLIAEVIARVLLPSLGDFPSPRTARLVVPITNRDPPCNVLYPPSGMIHEVLRRGEPGRPRVLHFGDSLVAGIGIPSSENFVSALGNAQPGVQHVNLGAVGAGLDVYLLAMRLWGPAAQPRLNVVYIFAGNDMFDLNARYLCCAHGGLLVDQGGRLTPRCPTAQWNIPLKAHLASSPPPFVLRALARPSRVAGHLLRFVIRVQQDAMRHGFRNLPSPGDPASQTPRWNLLDQRIRAIAATSREQNARLLMVVIPSRTTIEKTLGWPAVANDYWGDGPTGVAGHRRIVETARAAGVDVLDGWDTLRDAMQQDGVERVFANEYPGDVHLGRLGHQRFAVWLLPALQARGVNP